MWQTAWLGGSLSASPTSHYSQLDAIFAEIARAGEFAQAMKAGLRD